MNLELIEKLIRLANNNPNENEANLAARKVCEMLAEYQFGNSTFKYQPGERPRQGWPPPANSTRYARRAQEAQVEKEQERAKKIYEMYLKELEELRKNVTNETR